MTSPDFDPMLGYDNKKAILGDALMGKTLLEAFDLVGNENVDGRNGVNYALGTEDRYALLRWTNEDETSEYVRAVTIEDGETELDRAERVYNGAPEARNLVYRGQVDKEDAVNAALAYLDKCGTVERTSPTNLASGEIAGILQGEEGPVIVTEIGAAIFGRHIQAMQEQGRATYYPLQD